MTAQPGASASARAGSGEPAPAIARELTGQLRCASCRYELRGLSVRDRCPECGLAIQATLLSIVDPHAQELRPIDRPRLVAAGLVCWCTGSVVALLLGWALWLGLGSTAGAINTLGERMILAGAIAIGVAGLGSLAIARPHAGLSRARVIVARLGGILHAPAIVVWLDLGGLATSGFDQSLLAAWTGEPEPAPWRAERLVAWLLVAAIVALLRANLRLLAARSFLMRAARVDRQTMLAVIIAVLVAALGDCVAMAAASMRDSLAGTALLLGEVLVALGAALMTLGALGIMVDTFRLLPAVARQPVGYEDVMGEPARD